MDYVDAAGRFLAEVYDSLGLETRIFVWAILAFAAFFHLRFSRKAVAFGPTILTTLGIFATFLGIALGLSKFDSGNVQNSVPALLSGLKTAFWASVVGIFGALSLKIRDYIWPPKSEEGVTADDVSGRDLLEQLQGVEKALVGKEDGSIISQLKLTRQDTNDRLDQLKAAQTEALAKLSEMGSKALIEALRDVVRDFNAKITEQFGDNFKELNAAVGRMLDWQKAFMSIVESLVGQFEETRRLTEAATKDYGTLIEKSGIFLDVANGLSDVLTRIDEQQRKFNDLNESLNGLIKDVSKALPELETKITQISVQLTTSVTENQKLLNSALTENTGAIRNSIKSFGDGLVSANQEFGKQFTEMATKTKDQVTVLDAALSEELQKSLRTLGNQLAALSEKFVSDYTPLTDRLRSLLDASRRV